MFLLVDSVKLQDEKYCDINCPCYGYNGDLDIPYCKRFNHMLERSEVNTLDVVRPHICIKMFSSSVWKIILLFFRTLMRRR